MKLLVCIVSLLALGAHAWTCDISLVGNTTRPQPVQFSAAAVRCTPGLNESNLTLHVWVPSALTDATFAGVVPAPLPAPGNDSLLTFTRSNITFRSAQLQSIDAWAFNHIIAVNGSNITFQGINSSRNNAQQAAISITGYGQSTNALTSISQSTFSNSTCQAVAVSHCRILIQDSVFDGNIHYNGSGGALQIFNTDGSGAGIYNTTFLNNQVPHPNVDDGQGYGGAADIVSPYLVVDQCRFENNIGSANGGAVMLASNQQDDGTWASDEAATFRRCTFRNNSAVNVNGGGLYYQGSIGANDEVLTISDTIFEGNNASSGGGLSPWGVYRVILNGCQFHQNTAYYGRGGGLYTYGNIERVTSIFINSTTFTSNNATNIEDSQPGGIFDVGECAGAHISSASCVGFLNSTFESNIGIGMCLRDISGGCEPDPGYVSYLPPLFDRSTLAGPSNENMLNAFLGEDISIKVAADIRSCTFRNNTAASFLRLYKEPVQPQDPLAGGAALDMLAVPYSMMANNAFLDNSGRQGSAVHLDSCTASVIWNGTFDGNSATHEGGAIATVNSHGKGVLIGRSTISNSLALSGGAVYGDSGASVIITNGTRLVNNTAVTNGGAVDCAGCQNLTMQLQSSATGNQAQGQGGACYCSSCTFFQLSQVVLTNNSAGYGGAAFVDGTSATSVTLANISQASFVGNQAAVSPTQGGGGALYLSGGVTAMADNSFQGNSANDYGGGLAYTYQCFNFSSVPGEQSSAAYLWEQISADTQQIAAAAGNCSLVQSVRNSFQHNYAQIAGGALYATDKASLRLTCVNGTAASVGGGCAAWTNNTVQASTTVAGGTVRLQGYGGTQAFLPASITLEGAANVSNYVSNGNSKLPMVVHVQDQAGSDISSALSLESPLRALVSITSMTVLPAGSLPPLLQGQTQASAQYNGTISIADMSLVAVPGIYNVSVTLPDYPHVPAAFKLVSVRACAAGEVQTNPQTCTACPASSYSFNTSHASCDACPPNANCTGGANLIPVQQYWHSSPESDYIMQCPNNHACLGSRDELLRCKNASYAIQAGNTPVASPCDLSAPWGSTDNSTYMLKQCSKGYYGPVCSLCLRDEATGVHYGLTGISQCQPCRRSGVIVFAYIASTLLVILWLLFTIQITLQENRESAAGVTNPGITSELIRALTLWLQYITLLGAVNISAPAPIHWILSAASFAFATVTSGALSIDCLQSGSTNAAVQRLLLHLTMPILVLFILVIIQIIWWWGRPGPKSPSSTSPILVTGPSSTGPNFSSNSLNGSSSVNNASLMTNPSNASLITNTGNVSSASASVSLPSRAAELRCRLLVTLLTVVFYYYPSLLITTLSLFACYRLDPSQPQLGQNYPLNAQANWHRGYWVPDMTVQCFQGWHLALSMGLGIPLLVVVVIGIPLLPVYLLFRHRRKLWTTAVKLRLGFLYKSYRGRFWFWESFILVQTLALAAALVFATSLDAYFQLTVMLMVLVIGITVLAHYQPYEEGLSQSMQVFGMFTVAVTATGCLYFLDSDDIASTSGLNAAGILLLILNVVFVLVILALIFYRGGPEMMRWVIWIWDEGTQALSRFPGMSCFGNMTHSWQSSTVSGGSSLGRNPSAQVLLTRVFTRSKTPASNLNGLSSLPDPDAPVVV